MQRSDADSAPLPGDRWSQKRVRASAERVWGTVVYPGGAEKENRGHHRRMDAASLFWNAARAEHGFESADGSLLSD